MKRMIAILLAAMLLMSVMPMEVFAETEITSITITNADITPVAGENADDHLAYTLPENCHYSVTRHYWYDENASDSYSDAFVKGDEYDVYWQFKADTGYTFAETVTITINGSTEAVDTTFTEIDDEDATIYHVWTVPVEVEGESSAKEIISEITLTGADITPVEGDKASAHMVYTLPAGVHYSVAECYWYDVTADERLSANDVFVDGDEYQVGWYFEADEGYTFNDYTTGTINGEAALYSSGEEDGTMFSLWTPSLVVGISSEDIALKTIELTDADITPVVGDQVGDHKAYTIPTGSHFSCIKNYWYDEDGYGGLSDTDVFQEDNAYSVFWKLKSDKGYVFDRDTVVTINGTTAEVDKVYTECDGSNTRIFYVWTKPMITERTEKPNVIGEITLTGADIIPVPGEKATDHLAYTLPEGVHFSVDDHFWWDYTNAATFVDTFVEGYDYQVGWWLEADEGYTFAKHPTITINGTTANIDWSSTYIDSSDDTRYYVWATGRVSSNVVPGDADGDGELTMKDVLLARKYIAKLVSSVQPQADLDGDGEITMKDVLAMRKKIAKIG